MNLSRKTFIGIVLVGMLITVNPFGDESAAQRSGKRRHSPPPEAYTACEDKNAGDTAEFVSPRGHTVTGTCEEDGDLLVLRPDNPPGGRGRKNTNDE